MRRLIAALVIVAATGVVGGCGGDSEVEATGTGTGTSGDGFTVDADTTMTTAARLTRSKFVARVNKICRTAWSVIHQNFIEYSSTLSPRAAEGRRYANAVRLSYMAGIDFHIFDRIYDLGSPPGEEHDTEELIGAMQEGVERIQRGPRIYTPTGILPLFVDYNRRARQYRLDDCYVAGANLPKVIPVG